MSNRFHGSPYLATSGQHLTVSAAGPDAREAVAALIAILSEATKVGG
jgi:phosphotransferase system HPr-like phosphotransfer protein